jgi:YHS domain-containing protein
MMVTTGLMVLVGACAKREGSPERVSMAEAAMASEPSRGNSTSQDGPLTRVTDRSLVCMVNDQFMGRAQIPIEVEGRTYYGCCEMCKGRLANDLKSRTAKDPISGRIVDKATAIIGKTADGKTLYFESDKTFTAYLRHPSG